MGKLNVSTFIETGDIEITRAGMYNATNPGPPRPQILLTEFLRDVQQQLNYCETRAGRSTREVGICCAGRCVHTLIVSPEYTLATVISEYPHNALVAFHSGGMAVLVTLRCGTCCIETDVGRFTLSGSRACSATKPWDMLRWALTVTNSTII